MRPPATRIVVTLAAESFRDAMRRRIVPFVAAVSVLSLLAVDSCSSCAGGNVTMNGQQLDLSLVGITAAVMFSLLAMWVIVLGGLLASDHLTETLEDGSATLVLSRPVRRSEFVLARLLGSVGIAYATGAAILGGTAAIFHVRNELPLTAAIWGMVACAAGTLIVSALAMTLSLYLKRLATAVAVMLSVGMVTIGDSIALFTGGRPASLGSAIQEASPPLFASVVAAMSDWLQPATLEIDPISLAVKLAIWAVASLVVLVWAFQREELSG